MRNKIIPVAFAAIGLATLSYPLVCEGVTDGCNWSEASSGTYSCTFDSASGKCCQKHTYLVKCPNGNWVSVTDAVLHDDSSGCSVSGFCSLTA
jgi:hypothetical protein